MAAITICSDFGAQKNKVWHCFHCFPSISHRVMGPDAMIFVFWMLSFKPTFSLSSFTFFFYFILLYNSELCFIKENSKLSYWFWIICSIFPLFISHHICDSYWQREKKSKILEMCKTEIYFTFVKVFSWNLQIFKKAFSRKPFVYNCRVTAFYRI